jgi:pimeloyl-ACP methyl ester carboxylesterase
MFFLSTLVQKSPMIETTKVKVGEFEFDCRISGNKDHEPVILLHGFPESNIMYEQLMTDLTAIGYYCVAPNLRGYSEGARPKGKKHYKIDSLADDIIDIANALSIPKFHLVAHDWGAAVGWKVVNDFPNMIASWTAMSVPHIQSFFKAVAVDSVQYAKSVYIRKFQIPFLPEMKMRSKNYLALRTLWDKQSPEEVSDYLRILKQKGALTATINYYRANYYLTKEAITSEIIGDISVPTIFIWGNTDLAVGRVAVDGAAKYMKGEYKFLEYDAGHWILDEIYDKLQPEIIAHIKKHII